MKTLITTALIVLAPAVALAQGDAKPAQKPAAKTATAKTSAVKNTSNAGTPAKKTTTAAAAPKKATTAKARPKQEPAQHSAQLKSAATQVATGFIAADTPLSNDEMAIADRVEVGRINCELGAYVSVERDQASPGRFHVSGKNFKYHMQPVVTSTGAIRLEDQKNGAVWMQIANKSMLFNQKAGQRIADECMSPTQVTVAEAMKRNPPPSLLDGNK